MIRRIRVRARRERLKIRISVKARNRVTAKCMLRDASRGAKPIEWQPDEGRRYLLRNLFGTVQ